MFEKGSLVFVMESEEIAAVAMTTESPIQKRNRVRMTQNGLPPCTAYWQGRLSYDGERSLPASVPHYYPGLNIHNVVGANGRAIFLFNISSVRCFWAFFKKHKVYCCVIGCAFRAGVNHLYLQPSGNIHNEAQEPKVSSWHKGEPPLNVGW